MGNALGTDGLVCFNSCCYGCLDGPNGCVGCCENAPHDEPFSKPVFNYQPIPPTCPPQGGYCPPPPPSISIVINNNCNNNNNNSDVTEDQNPYQNSGTPYTKVVNKENAPNPYY